MLDTIVAPQAQRQGVGAEIVSIAVREARKAGCEWLHKSNQHLIEVRAHPSKAMPVHLSLPVVIRINSMSNLAVTLREQGDLAGARKLKEETLEIRSRVLGPEHPDTLTSMGNLAETLSTQGDLAWARKLQEETLHIRRRVLGAGAPRYAHFDGQPGRDAACTGRLAGAQQAAGRDAARRRTNVEVLI